MQRKPNPHPQDVAEEGTGRLGGVSMGSSLLNEGQKERRARLREQRPQRPGGMKVQGRFRSLPVATVGNLGCMQVRGVGRL